MVQSIHFKPGSAARELKPRHIAVDNTARALSWDDLGLTFGRVERNVRLVLWGELPAFLENLTTAAERIQLIRQHGYDPGRRPLDSVLPRFFVDRDGIEFSGSYRGHPTTVGWQWLPTFIHGLHLAKRLHDEELTEWSPPPLVRRKLV